MKTERLTDFIIRYKYLFFSLPIVLGIISLYFIKDIKIVTRSTDFIPTNHPFIKVQKELIKHFGGLNRVNIAIEVRKGTILNPVTLKKVYGIFDELSYLDEVNSRRILCLFSRQIKDIKIHKDGFVVKQFLRDIPKTKKEWQALKERILKNPLVYGPIVSKDFKATLIQAEFKEGIPSRVIYEKVNNIIRKYRDKNRHIYVSGRPILEGYIDTHLDFILYIFFITVFIILLLLFFAFRKKRGIILPFFSGSMSVLISLSTFKIFHYTLTPFTILVPFLIFIITISHSIQFIERYFELSRQYVEKEKVSKETLICLLSPIRASLFTDFLGFSSLYLIPILSIKSIAILGSSGILSIFITVVGFLPACFAILSLPQFKASKNAGMADSFLEKLGDFCAKNRNRAVVLCVFIAILSLSIYGIKKMKVGEIEAGTSILYRSAPYNKAERKINHYFMGSTPYFILVKGKKKNALVRADVIKEMDELETYLRRHSPEVGYGLSLADYIKLMNLEVFGGNKRYFCVPNSDKALAEYLFLYETNSFPGEFSVIVSPSHNNANIRLDLKDCRGSTIEKVISETRHWIKKYHKTPWAVFKFAGGEIGLLAATNDVIKKGLLINILILSVLIFLRVALALRSLIGGLLLFIPLLLSIVFTFGSFGLLKVPFTLATLPVAAMGIGLGIDYSIYLASRIKQEIKQGLPLIAAVRSAVKTCGQAVFFSGIILTIGVYSWLFSNLKLQAKLGGTLGFLLFINMLSALILLPTFLLIIKPKFLLRREK